VKIIIVGAGVMGMMQARDLAAKGINVVLLDKGVCGGEASWAGGGIISPLYPWRYSNAVTALASWSQAYYPNLIQTLEAETEIDPQITRHGLLMLDVSDKERALAWSSENQSWLQEVDEPFIYDLEPGLREGLQQGMWMSQVSSVRNPRLLKSLYMSLLHNPLVEIREESAVVSFSSDGYRVLGVETITGDIIQGDKVVLCTGAWSQSVSGDEKIQIQPAKGQMVLFDAQPGLVNRIVLSNGQYLIPRRDGKVVAGSTLEHTGFDKMTTQQAKDTLTDMAINLFPALADCYVSHHWAGLRPETPSGVPYIGKLPNYENVYINSGHFRNGLVLAPASVNLLSGILCDEELPVDPSPYDPART